MADPSLNVTVTADTSDAMAKLEALQNEMQGIPSVLLESKRDWWPYALGLSGWIAAVVIAVLQQ